MRSWLTNESVRKRSDRKSRKRRRTQRYRRQQLRMEMLEDRRVLAGPGPEVLSIVRADANPTNANSVAFTVTFDEAVTGVDASDFIVDANGPTFASVEPVSGSGAVYTVNVGTGVGDGSLSLDLIDDDSIVSAANSNKPLGGAGTTGNKDGSFTSGESYAIDKTSPSSFSVAALEPSPTNLQQVRYQIEFDEPVIGLSTDNLQPFISSSNSTDPISGVSVTEVTGAGDTYDVLLNTGTGTGNFGLRLVNDGNFSDLVGNSPSVVSGIGDVYQIDRIAPTVEAVVLEDASPTNASTLSFLITLSESITAFGLGDVSIDQVGFPEAAFASLQTVSGTQKRVVVTPGEGEGTISIDVTPGALATDFAGNQLITPANAFDAYVVDTRAPEVESITRASASPTSSQSLDFNVLFTESVVNVDPDDFEVAATGVSGATVSQVSGSGAAYTVTVTYTGGSGTLGLNLQAANSISDTVGNSLSGGAVTGPLYTVSSAAFDITANEANKDEGNVGTTPFTFTVTRSNDANGTATVDYAVSGTAGDAANADDFGGTFPSGTVSFADGETTQVVTIDVSGDLIAETDETFTVTLSNPSAPAAISIASADGVIRNDDAPALSVAIDVATVTEGGTTAMGTVQRTGPVDQDLTVTLAADPLSRLVIPETVLIPAGSTSATFPVDVVDDDLVTGDETILVTAATGPPIEFDSTYGDAGAASISAVENESFYLPTFGEHLVQSDGKVVTSYNRQRDRFNIVRFNVDGTPDTTFGDNGIVRYDYEYFVGLDESPGDIVQLPNGKLVVSFVRGPTALSPPNKQYLLQLNTDGSIDTSFGASGVLEIDATVWGLHNDLVALSDNSIVAISTRRVNSAVTTYAKRILANGTIDPNFDDSAVTPLQQGTMIVALPDDSVLLAGNVAGGASQVVKLQPGGGADSNFGMSGVVTISGPANVLVKDIAVDGSGRILLFGARSDVAGDQNAEVTRLLPNGSVDTSFGTNGFANLPGENTSAFIQRGDVDSQGRILTAVYDTGLLQLIALDSNGSEIARSNGLVDHLYSYSVFDLDFDDQDRAYFSTYDSDYRVYRLGQLNYPETIPSNTRIDVVENDAATVRLSGVADGNETAASNGSFTVAQTLAAATDTTVTYSVSGTAKSGDDYSTLDGTVTIAAGTTSSTISVPVFDDLIVEGTESVTVTLTGITNSSPGVSIETGADTASIDIVDNDTATVGFVGSGPFSFESADGTFNPSLFQSTIVNDAFWQSHRFEVVGTSTTIADVGGYFRNTDPASATLFAAITALTSDSDYPDSNDLSTTDVVASTTFLVPGNLSGGDVMTPFSATLDPGWYALSFGTGAFGAPSAGSGTTDGIGMIVLSNDLAPSQFPFSIQPGIRFNNTNAATRFVVTGEESTRASESGPTNGIVHLTQSAEATADTVVTYSVGGTATSGSDYVTLSRTATIPAGSTSTTITIPVIDDSLLEATELVSLTLTSISSSSPGVTIDSSGTSSLVNILDNETAEANLSVTIDGDEDGPASVVFTVTLDTANTTGAPITFEFDDLGTGTATPTADYVAIAADAQIVVPDGSTSGTFTIDVVDDGIFESTETLVAQISSPSLASVAIGTATATANIVDNTPATLSIAVTDASKPEGNTGSTAFTFTVTRFGNTTGVVSVDYAVTGSGALPASADDFAGTFPSGTIEFADGESAKVVTVNVSGDTDVEADDGFTVSLSNPSSFASIADSTAEGLIADDDAPPLVQSIAASQSFVSGDDPVSFIVTFNESVTGVDVSDFDVVQSAGVTGAQVSSVSDQGDGVSYAVVVQTGSGDGTLQLRLNDNDSIVDQFGVVLGGNGSGNGDAVSDVLTVERDPRRTVSGVVFDDANDNGVKDPGEPGAENAGIYLDYNQNGFRDANEPEIRTPNDDPATPGIDEGGVFSFANVPLGTFDLAVRDFWFSYLSSPGRLISVTLEFEDTELDVDVPATRNLASVRGFVYEDLNANGIRDDGEPGIAGQRIYRDNNGNDAFDSFETNVITQTDDPTTPEDETGAYEIVPVPFDWDPLSSDFFWFRYDENLDWFATSPIETGRSYSSPDQVEIFDVGLATNQSAISGLVYDDVNANGVQEFGEEPLSGWIVFLDANDNGVRDAGEPSTTTLADDPATDFDETGSYRFEQLSLGTYQVAIESQAGYVVTSPMPVTVQINSSDDQIVADFAVHVNETRVEGVVFEDSNQNGIQDSGEEGIGGATVYVDLNDNRVFDAGEPNVVTPIDGSYLLDAVMPGDSVVRVSLPFAADIVSPSVSDEVLFAMAQDSLIAEIDPSSNSIIRQQFVTGPFEGLVDSTALAFDGTWLYAGGRTPPGSPAVVVIDPSDFSAVSYFPVSTGNSPPNGAAVLGDELFLLNHIDNLITVYDLNSRTLSRTLNVPAVNSGGSYTALQLDLAFAMGESADGTELLVRNAADEILVVHPQTAVILDVLPTPPETLRHQGLAGAGGSIFISHDAGELSTLDATGSVLQTETLAISPDSLAARVFEDNSHRLTLLLDAASIGNDFAVLPLLRTVSGVQFQDANHNGVQDADDLPLEGVTVYVDSNNNGLLDSGESNTVSGSDGRFTLTDVSIGEQWIRRTWPAGYRPTTFKSSADFLVATTDVPDAASSTGESLRIRYLDPQDGSIVDEISTEIEVIDPNNATTDGQFIYAIDNARDVLIQLTAQGGLVREIPIPPLSWGTPYSQGPAVVDGTVYWITGSDFKIRTLDPESGTLSNERSIKIASGLIGQLPSLPPSGNIVESPDGQSIWFFANADDRVFVLNPLTAQIESFFNFSDTGNGVWSAAALNSQLYLRGGQSQGALRIYDETLAPIGTLPSTDSQGLGAANFVEYGVVISGTEDVALNQGYVSTAGSILGHVGEDANNDGIIDGGELPIEGVTVYIDANENHWPDSNELATTSAADGSYTLSGLEPGAYLVSTQPPVGYRPSDAYTSTGRLFGAELYSSPSSQTEYFAELWEFDPDTGAVVNRVFTDIPLTTGAIGLAYYRDRLILTDDFGDMIYELTLDGQLIDSRPLGEPFTNPTNGQTEYSAVTDYGPEVFGGTIFSVRDGLHGYLNLVEYDPATNEFIRERPLTYDWGLTEPPGTFNPETPTARKSFSISHDGQSLLLDTDDGYRFTIDPVTAVASSPISTDPVFGNLPHASAVLDSERYIATGGAIEVVDANYEFIRGFSTAHTQYGLASANHRVASAIVSVTTSNAVTQDFGFAKTLASISGQVVLDSNGSGSLNGSESGSTGQSVFVDLNDNGLLDIGEPTEITDSEGRYTITGVAPGEYVVRVVPPTQSNVIAWGDSVTRVFVHQNFSGEDSIIQEIDPGTGEILNSFAAPPDPTDIAIGFASDGRWLYQSDSDGIDILSPETGLVVDSIAGPSGSGLAIVGSKAFVANPDTDTIAVFDLTRRQYLESWELGEVNFNAPGSIQIRDSLTEAPDGVNVIVGLENNNALVIDVSTGLIVAEWSQVFFNAAAGGAGGEVFEPNIYSGQDLISLGVRDHMGLKIRVLPALGSGVPHGIAAAEFESTSHRVRVFENQTTVDLDFGIVADTQSISGQQFIDADGSGTFDIGEEPLAGLTVFADLNANGFLDEGEPLDVSANDGSYTLANVPVGPVIVDTLPVEGLRQAETFEATETLIGMRRISDNNSPSGYRLQLVLLNPNGASVSTVFTDVPTLNPGSLTQWGNRYLVIDNGRDLLLQLSLDGSLISETPLPSTSGGLPAFAYGMTVLDDTVYLSVSGPNRLIRFDPLSDSFYGATPITSLWDPEFAGYPLMPLLSESMTATVDGEALLLFSRDDDRVFRVNPVTGRVMDVQAVPQTYGFVYASTVLEGQYYIYGQNTNGMGAFDANFASVGQAIAPFVSGLTTYVAPVSGSIVEVSSGAARQLEMAHRSTASTISGNVSRDANGDGVVDTGEGAENIVVYLDENRDGIRDAEEAWTLTDAAGSYVFMDVLPGDVAVAVDDLDRALANQNEVWLYGVEFDNGVGTINRHDPITGDLLSSFPTPGLQPSAAGLAMNADSLFYSEDNGVWSLDPITGQSQVFYDLPDGSYHGLAAVDDNVFVLDANAGTITRIDTRQGLVAAPMEINSINGTSHAFGFNLSPWTDGYHLLNRTISGDALVIDPITGLIVETYLWSGSSRGVAFAANEFYRAWGDTIRVQNDLDMELRELPIGYVAFALAAIDMPGASIHLRASPDAGFHDQNFHLVSSPMQTSSSITGRLFLDANSDGIENHNEQGLAGRTVYIDSNNNGQWDVGEPSQLTSEDDPQTPFDEAGNYRFTESAPGTPLTPGTYTIRQVVPEFWQSTTPGDSVVVTFATDTVVATSGLGSNPPDAPTDIVRSDASINENLDTSAADLLFSTLSAVDDDVDDTHSYELVSGEGDTDNARFLISADQLYLRQGEVLDYESQSTYAVRVRVTDAAGLIFEKSLTLGVNNLVEVTKEDITVGDGTAQRSRVESLTIQFDAEVTIAPDAFTVIKRGPDGGTVDVAYTTRLDQNGHTIADLTFSGSFVEHGSLVDGNYQLTIIGTKISSIEGNGFDSDSDGLADDNFVLGDTESDDFFSLYGDTNGDGLVGAIDYFALRNSYGKSNLDPGFERSLDFDSDGLVGASDFFAFRNNYGSPRGF